MLSYGHPSPMNTKSIYPVVLGLALAAANHAAANILDFNGLLSGLNEFPANASPGTGVAHAIYDDVAHTLHVTVSFSGLLGLTTASHMHAPTLSPFTGAAGVATTTPTFAGFPLGVTAGTYDNTLDLTLASSFNPAYVTANGGVAGAEAALIDALNNGKSYLNVHTSQFPGGEIRGFLSVPDAATTGSLLGFGLLGLLAVGRFVRHSR